MAPENSNSWLSFSHSSIEKLSSIDSQPKLLQSPMKLAQFDNSSASQNAHDSQHFFFDDETFFADGTGQSINNSTMYNSFMPPKQEDFLGCDTVSAAAYGHMENTDSSMTQIYDHGCPNSVLDCFNIEGDFKNVAEFNSEFNSVPEVGESGTELRVAAAEGGGVEGLSLGVGAEVDMNFGTEENKNVGQSDDKAVVLVKESCKSKKVSDNFGQRTSIYRGVTRHRWTGRYEAHLWDNSFRKEGQGGKEGQGRKGRQVYLGGYDKEDNAARSYDLAALKYWGTTATTNFPISSYTKEIDDMKHMSKQEFIASLRRKSSGFSRGASKYRGVTRHHQQGRWQARIGRVAGNKDLYLGTFATEEDAAEAYDIAAIKFRGMNAVTNFEMNRYNVDSIMNNPLPIGGAAKKVKLALEAEEKSSLAALQAIIEGNDNISFSGLQHASAIPRGVSFEAAPLNYYNYFQQFHPMYDTSCADSSTVAPLPLLPSQPDDYYIWPSRS